MYPISRVLITSSWPPLLSHRKNMPLITKSPHECEARLNPPMIPPRLLPDIFWCRIPAFCRARLGSLSSEPATTTAQLTCDSGYYFLRVLQNTAPDVFAKR